MPPTKSQFPVIFPVGRESARRPAAGSIPAASQRDLELEVKTGVDHVHGHADLRLQDGQRVEILVF